MQHYSCRIGVKMRIKFINQLLSVVLAIIMIVSSVVFAIPTVHTKASEAREVELLAETTIVNGELWYDDQGEPIQGHGGNILFHEGKYYWVGENKYSANFSGVALYSSDNLMDWKFENMILTPETPDDDGNIGFCTIERPKLIFNGSEFVLWAHWENGENYSESKLIVAKCDTINGDYQFVNRFNPQSRTYNSETGEYEITTNRSLDMTIYNDVTTDESGTIHNQAYLISANGHNMALYKLTENCMDVIPEESYQFWIGAGREAPAMVKVEDYYVLVTSGQSGWLPNQSMYGYTRDITDPDGWTNSNSLKSIGNNSTYYSQPTNIAVIEDSAGNRQYIYMGDRWKPGQLRNSSCVWLPLNIEIDENADWKVNLSMDYLPKWNFVASEGTVVIPESILVSQEKTLTSTIPGTDAQPLSQAVDGIVDTDKTWGNNNYYGLSQAKLPFTIQMDMEAIYDLSRMDLTTRLVNGSETYYQYIVEGSIDGNTWTKVLDESDNTMVGFRSNPLSGLYRYLRITVNNIIDHKNGANATWAAGIVEWQVYASGKADDHEVLKNLVESYEDIKQGYFTDDSYTAFKEALEYAKNILSNSDATNVDLTVATKTLLSAYAALTMDSNAPVSVNTLTGTATYAGQIPTLPKTVLVTTADGDVIDKEVVWPEVNSDMFQNAYDCVMLEGTVPYTDLTVLLQVEVIPKNLMYFIDSGTNGTGKSAAHTAVVNSGLAVELKNSSSSDATTTGDGIWKRSSGHVTVNQSSVDKYISITGGNSTPITYSVTLEPGVYDVTVAGAKASVQGKTANGVIMTAQGGTFEDGLLIAEADTRVTNQLTVTEENMITLFMTGTKSGYTAGVSFLGIAKHNEELEPVVPGSSLTSSDTIENKAGTEFNVQVRTNKLEKDAKLLEFTMDLPSMFEVKDVTVNSNVTGGNLLWNVEETESGNVLRGTYANLTNYESIRTTETEAFDLFQVRLVLKEVQEVGSKVVLVLRTLNQYLDSENSIEYADGTQSAEVGFVGAEKIGVKVTELYIGDGSDIIPDGMKAIKAEFTGLVENFTGSIVFASGEDKEPLYYSEEFSVKSGKPVYVFTVDSSITTESLMDAENYTINTETGETVTFGDTNNDGYIDAQDALEQVSLWLRKTTTEITSKLVLTYNVNADAKINNADVLTIVEYFIKDKAWPVLSK